MSRAMQVLAGGLAAVAMQAVPGDLAVAARPLLPPGSLEKAAASVPGVYRMVPAEVASATQAVHVTVAARTPNPWDVQLRLVSDAEVEAGDTVAVALAVRSIGGPGRLIAKLQDADNQALVRKDIPATPEWRRVLLPVSVAGAHPAGGLSLALFFGLQKQELELAGVALLDAGKGAKPEALAVPGLASLPAADLSPAALKAAAVEAAPAAPAGPFQLPALPPLDTTARRYVMLKLDDLRGSGTKTVVHPRFQRVVDELVGRKLKGSLGVITKTMEQGDPAYFDWIRKNAIENGGAIEFWFHGFDHGMGFMLEGTNCTAEFSGPPYAYQSEHFEQGCRVMKEKTGLTFHTFGSAGNATDATGVRVLREHPEIVVWLFGNAAQAAPGTLALKRSLNLEYAVGKVGFDAFFKGYPAHRKDEYLVLQGHPAMWTDAAFVEFQHVLDLLVADQWQFVTPSEYYQLRKAGPGARSP